MSELILAALNNQFLIQGLGLLGFIVMVGSFQCNNRNHILYLHVLALSALGAHLALIGAYTGAAMMATLTIRNLIFAQKDRWPWAAKPVVYYLTLVAILMVGIFSWFGWASLFAIAGSFIATYGFWSTEPRRVRFVVLISALVWIPYGVVFKSYPMLLLQLFIIVSILLAIYRYDWLPTRSFTKQNLE